MKKAATILFLLSFAAQSFGQALVIANFYLNQSYIIANKCENKSRPTLHCNGKCQLAKKLKQQEKKEEQNPERKLSAKNEICSHHYSFYYSPNTLDFLPQIFISLSDNRIVDRSIPFFHPPSA